MKDFFWDECPQGWMLKTPPPKSLDLHLSVRKCKCWKNKAPGSVSRSVLVRACT